MSAYFLLLNIKMNIIEKGLAFILMEICFWTGHIWSRTILRVGLLGFTYPIYNTLMIWSCDINDLYGFELWESPKKDTINEEKKD